MPWSKCETCVRIRQIAYNREREASDLNESTDGCDLSEWSHIEKQKVVESDDRNFCETQGIFGNKKTNLTTL